MTKMTKRFGAAALLAVLGMMVSTGYCKDAMEEMRAGTAGFETGMDITEMINAQPLELAVPQPEAAVPAFAAGRDIFTEIKACNSVDRVFVKRPSMEEALRMLAPCMKGVTKLYGNKVYAESTIMNPDNIQIVVLDSVAGKTIVEDLNAAIAKRHGGLFGHKVSLSVMDVSNAAARATAGQFSVAGAVALPVPGIENVPQADPFTTKALEQADITAMQAIIGRVNYMGKEEPGDCYSYEAVIESRVRGFNPAKWSIIFVDAKGTQVAALTDMEIRSMIAMFDRLHVVSTRLADINLISEVTINARSCHTQPLVWTATYRKNPKFD